MPALCFSGSGASAILRARGVGCVSAIESFEEEYGALVALAVVSVRGSFIDMIIEAEKGGGDRGVPGIFLNQSL
jgi:hypothetical protein